ncbi:MAG: hypothetical protein HFH95_14305 [Lachnospiraceae bacterium]|nr:hypothetical protein [uncultured Acetatifactor sp.]MCI8544457.1 hypothetical protein [Lachnospiraceae bacterium]
MYSEKYMIGVWILDELMENEMFCNGIIFGVNLYQNKIIAAHERGEPINIGDELFFLQSSREKLEDLLSEICR